MCKTRERILSFLLAILMVFSCFVGFPMKKAHAAEPLDVVARYDKAAVKPGGIITVTVYLENYADMKEGGIGSLSVEMPAKTEHLTYVEGSKSTPVKNMDFSANESLIMIGYVPLTAGANMLPKDTTVLMTFQMKADDKVTEDITEKMYMNSTIGDLDDKEILYQEKDVPIPIKATSTLAVSKNPAKVTFYEGDTFTAEGGELAYEDADGRQTIAMNNKEVTIDPKSYDMNKTGTYNVKASWKGKDCTYPITVEELRVTALKLDPKPTNTTYKVNKSTNLDTTGGKVNLMYNSGKKETLNLTADMCSVADFTKIGVQTITVTLPKAPGLSDTFDINVTDKALDHIEITTLPKITFVKNTDFSVDGGKVTLSYDNDTQQIVDMVASMCSGYDKTKLGTQTITVTYAENGVTKTTIYDITVVEKQIISVEIVKAPTPALKGTVAAEYIEEQDFDMMSDGVAKINYDNNTSENVAITKDMLSGYDMKIIGTQTVTIKPVETSDKTATYPITVSQKEATSITVKAPNKVNYLIGKDTVLDTTGGAVMVNWNNGKSDDPVALTVEMCSTPDLSTLGKDKIVTVNYSVDGKILTGEFKINVLDKEVAGMTITTEPIKEFVEGSTFSVIGGKITVGYNNGTNEEMNLLVDWCTIDGKPIDETVMKVPGTYTVTVTYNKAFTDTYNMTVKEKSVESIAVTTNPTKMSYVEGTAFEPVGGLLTVTYDNQTTQTINLEDQSVTCDVNMSVIGTAIPVTVVFEGKTTTFNIEIVKKSLNSIQVSKLPQSIYLVGDDLNLTGGELVVKYNNNTSDTVLMNAEGVMVSGYDKTKASEQILTVNYDGETTTFKVDVISREKVDALIAKIDKIEVSKLTIEDKTMILDLKVEYDTLFDIEKAAVPATTLQNLNDAVAKINELDRKVTGINISKAQYPDKVEFIDGDVFSAAGGKITLIYDNSTTDVVSIEDAWCSGYDMNKVGAQTVTITYGEQKLTATYPIVVKASSVAAIEIETMPQVQYIEGQNFSALGGILKVTYQNGKTETIELDASMCSNYDMKKVGNQKVTVTYNGKTTSYDIEVRAKALVSIAVTKAPQNEYLEGDKLNLKDGEITCTYDNGSNDVIAMTDKNVKVIGYDSGKVETQTLTATYMNKTTVFDVKVVSREKVNTFIAKLDKLDLAKLTLSDRRMVLHLKDEYEALSNLEKAAVSAKDIQKLNDAIAKINKLEKQNGGDVTGSGSVITPIKPVNPNTGIDKNEVRMVPIIAVSATLILLGVIVVMRKKSINN